MRLKVRDTVVIGYDLDEMPYSFSDAFSSSECRLRENDVDLIISEGITAIGKEAFAGCRELRSVTFPESMREIGTRAFKDCVCLESVVMNGGIEDIGPFAFKGCEKIRKIKLPEKLKVVSGSAFKDCYSLKEVIINDRCEEIRCAAFEKTDIEDIFIPPSVKTIKLKAFNMAKLKRIRFSEGLEYLGDFSLAKNELEEIILPESIRHIGAYWISNTFRTLKRVYLPDNLSDIDVNAFCPAGDEDGRWDIYEVNAGALVIKAVDEIIKKCKDPWKPGEHPRRGDLQYKLKLKERGKKRTKPQCSEIGARRYSSDPFFVQYKQRNCPPCARHIAFRLFRTAPSRAFRTIRGCFLVGSFCPMRDAIIKTTKSHT